jgi:hypothetical protein
MMIMEPSFQTRRLGGSAVALMVAVCCLAASSSLAQQPADLDHFTWKKSAATGTEVAATRSGASLNFFDVGDLSDYSKYLVERYLARISTAAGLTIDRSKATGSTVAIVHDTQVFSRLKNDKPSFHPLGIPDDALNLIEKQLSDPDTAKCINWTLVDENGDIRGTIILISEKSNICLADGLLSSFGVKAEDISSSSLVDVCILYEGRRLGLRDRQSLTQKMPALRDVCIAKLEDAK